MKIGTGLEQETGREVRSPEVVQTQEPEVRRVNLVLTVEAYEELARLSKETRRSMTELVRYGLGLVKIATEEARNGNKLLITTGRGKALREIVLPK